MPIFATAGDFCQSAQLTEIVLPNAHSKISVHKNAYGIFVLRL
ncbi:4380_t:CDS:2 [Funneliformis caledonium]|uniref:4380_t:CDS:1 n=1 Tax=Funneliformis caledonium TaxID=1117310 RepID=A0A9N9FHE1_9GLOM|nr:4380_t:CDS:2 [Funneliformis caledonium]